MPSGLNPWKRIVHAIDALSLAKIALFAIGAFVGTALPLYAIGMVFWLPILAAASLFVLRWLGFSVRTQRPPARLGLPLSSQLANSCSRQDACAVTSSRLRRFSKER